MNRDIQNIKRDLESTKNNDIIYKKAVLEKVFNEDPDLKEVLGVRDKRPLNKYLDPDHPTIQELELRKEIENYNRMVNHKQILPYIKVNGTQKMVSNYIMFDVRDYEPVYGNKALKEQQIIVIVMVSEDDMDTEYGIQRADLLSYIVKDLLCWSNCTGMQLKCISDFDDIIDDRYYARTLKFESKTPNVQSNGFRSLENKYDRFP